MPASLVSSVGSVLRRIIGRALLPLALALGLAGCSVVRLTYDQAPNLLYWWIDGYVDLNGEQTPRLRDGIERWVAWHRRSQLPEYAALLARAQREVTEPTSAAAICALTAEAERRVDAALEAAVPAAAELMLSLTPEQLQHIERRLAKSHDEMRAEFARGDAAERKAASLKRSIDRFETVYGRLDDAQRERLAGMLAKSTFDADRWLAERRLRQREMLQTLARAAAGRSAEREAALAQAQAAARVIAERALHSPRPDYRVYQQRLVQDNCALVAAMHNAMTPAQRQAARAKLKGWEDDVRVLMAAAANAADPRSAVAGRSSP